MFIKHYVYINLYIKRDEIKVNRHPIVFDCFETCLTNHRVKAQEEVLECPPTHTHSLIAWSCQLTIAWDLDFDIYSKRYTLIFDFILIKFCIIRHFHQNKNDNYYFIRLSIFIYMILIQFIAGSFKWIYIIVNIFDVKKQLPQRDCIRYLSIYLAQKRYPRALV